MSILVIAWLIHFTHRSPVVRLGHQYCRIVTLDRPWRLGDCSFLDAIGMPLFTPFTGLSLAIGRNGAMIAVRSLNSETSHRGRCAIPTMAPRVSNEAYLMPARSTSPLQVVDRATWLEGRELEGSSGVEGYVHARWETTRADFALRQIRYGDRVYRYSGEYPFRFLAPNGGRRAVMVSLDSALPFPSISQEAKAFDTDSLMFAKLIWELFDTTLSQPIARVEMWSLGNVSGIYSRLYQNNLFFENSHVISILPPLHGDQLSSPFDPDHMIYCDLSSFGK